MLRSNKPRRKFLRKIHRRDLVFKERYRKTADHVDQSHQPAVTPFYIYTWAQQLQRQITVGIVENFHHLGKSPPPLNVVRGRDKFLIQSPPDKTNLNVADHVQDVLILGRQSVFLSGKISM